MEDFFNEDQLCLIDRYRNGKTFFLGELVWIPAKFRDGSELNLKAIDEKIEEDKRIRNFLSKEG
tara:strand:+ start:402 stop:593 length:192 start_codon:yes stop_codon:yes gene_type:complete